MIIVTGHLGFIGSHFVKRLHPSSYIGIDRKEGNDILMMEVFPQSKKEEINIVYHFAAQTSVIDSVADPIEDARNNILSTIRIAKAYPKARIIYTGSGGASEQKSIESPYGLSKKVAGEYLKLLHNDYVICNLPNVFGPRGKGVVEKFLEDEVLNIYGDGGQTRDFVHVSDIVDGLVRASDWLKGEYFFGSGRAVRILELVKAVGKSWNQCQARNGELYTTHVDNTTPNWKPVIDVLQYLMLNK